MDANDYQSLATKTAFPYREAAHDIAQDPVLAEKVIRIMYTAIGLGEQGEAQEVTKKHVRSMRHAGNPEHTMSHSEARDKKLDELGDLLWYIANDAWEWDLSLTQVMEHNVNKLRQRMSEGTLAVEDR